MENKKQKTSEKELIKEIWKKFVRASREKTNEKWDDTVMELHKLIYDGRLQAHTRNLLLSIFHSSRCSTQAHVCITLSLLAQTL